MTDERVRRNPAPTTRPPQPAAPPPGANFLMTHCVHGLDLRTNARCFLCRPLSAAEMERWLWAQNVPEVLR